MDTIDLSSFFKTQSQANDFSSRLATISKEIYQTNFTIEKALTEQFGVEDKLPDYTLLRTPVWWTAIGLITHDIFRSYQGGAFTEEMRDTFLRRLAKVDWSLGNPDFGFLGAPVADRDRKTGELKPIPTDGQGRPVITRFHGGSKAYFNLAAFLRRKIGLYGAVDYGDDYGVSIRFDADGKPIDAASEVTLAEPVLA